MLEINVTVAAPELAGAIQSLAAALSGTALPAAASPVVSPPAPVQPSAAVAPAAAPTAASVPAAPPVVPVAAAPMYDRDQIMTAGSALIDAGKINELVGLLNTFGVKAVTQLKQDQLGAFATELRKLGAQI